MYGIIQGNKGRNPVNKALVVSVLLFVAIIIAASFGLQAFPHAAIQISNPALVGQELYVCPAAVAQWDSIATALHPFTKHIIVLFFFIALLLTFYWGWALYQNLLNDKFKQDAFKNVWGFTKYTFWAGLIVLMLVTTPNRYRTVHINGRGGAGDWVLCENNTPGARPVMAKSVVR